MQERTYEINLEKYRNGNLTGMDLQQFQNQLTTAKQDYTSAIISYKIELLNLKTKPFGILKPIKVIYL